MLLRIEKFIENLREIKMNSTKTITIIPFSGRKENWSMWKEKYKARVRLLGYIDVLEGRVKVPEDSKVDLRGDEKRIRTLNSELYSDLLLRLNDDITFGCVTRAKSIKWADGNAREAWINLVEKFEGNMKSNQLELERTLLISKMKPYEDPENWITKLERVRWELEIKHSYKMSDQNFLNRVITLLPENYNHVYHSFTRQIESTVEPLTVDKARNELVSFYEKEIKNKRNEDTNIDELGDRMNRVMFSFKDGKRERTMWGKCTWCYSKKHGLSDCPYAQRNDRSMYMCDKCDNPYHTYRDCGKMRMSNKEFVEEKMRRNDENAVILAVKRIVITQI